MSWRERNGGRWATLISPKYQMWKSKNDVVGVSRDVLFDSDFDFGFEFEFGFGSRWRDDDKRMKCQAKGVDEN